MQQSGLYQLVQATLVRPARRAAQAATARPPSSQPFGVVHMNLLRALGKNEPTGTLAAPLCFGE